MRHYGRVALLMAGIVLVSVVLTVITGGAGVTQQNRTVVTTTYALYVAAQNLLADLPDVRVTNLTGAATGCLHDYQLSPANRITLAQADLVLINGGGAEAFLEDVLPTLTAPVADTGEAVTFLPSVGHDHGDDHEDDHEDDHDHGAALNEHVWTSPVRYAAQVSAAADALAALLPEHETAIRARETAYRGQIEAVDARLRRAAAAVSGGNCIIMHESLAYLAEDWGLTVVASLPVGEESGVSAGDLAAAQRAVQADPAMLVLYDDQYTVRYHALDRAAAPGRVLALHTGARGTGSAGDWLDSMTRNAEMLEKLTGDAP